MEESSGPGRVHIDMHGYGGTFWSSLHFPRGERGTPSSTKRIYTVYCMYTYIYTILFLYFQFFIQNFVLSYIPPLWTTRLPKFSYTFMDLEILMFFSIYFVDLMKGMFVDPRNMLGAFLVIRDVGCSAAHFSWIWKSICFWTLEAIVWRSYWFTFICG